jgi:hypothetical protein
VSINVGSVGGAVSGNATLVRVSDGAGTNLALTGTGQAQVVATPPTITAANILDGRLLFVATTAATTLITIPAGRTWIGTIGASTSVAVAGASAVAGEATGIFTTAGAGVTPAAGAIFGVHCLVGANVVGGTVGSDGSDAASTRVVVIAPGANAVTIQVASTNTGTSSVVDAWAIGELQ